MSSGPPKSFKFSSNFMQIISQRKQQTQQFIKQFAQQKRQKSQEKANSLKKKNQNQSLFKLNTKSQALINQVPIEVIKKKSQTRLQSMHDDEHLTKNKFNLLQNQNQKKLSSFKEKREILKKYNIDLNMVMASQNRGKTTNKINENQEAIIQQEQDPNIIKPSQLYSLKTKISDPFKQPCIIQTPLLPCFSSEFLAVNNLTTQKSSKKIREGQGVWRIGKIKIKRNNKEGTLKIGDIQFTMQDVGGQGKCISIMGQNLYKLPNWKGMWIAQPTDQLFKL